MTALPRTDFPFFPTHPGLVYFDNAATTQKPRVVIDAISQYLSSVANPGRGAYPLAHHVGVSVADVRKQVATFLNARGPHEVVFTSGATQSLNMVALSWGIQNLKDGDEIVYCPDDHASTVLPWIQLKELLSAQNVHIRLVPFSLTVAGDVNVANIVTSITERTRVLLLTHVHNVYGDIVDVAHIRKNIRPDILICIDACQTVGHIPVDVQALGVDFLCFSGHKMFASEGIGVLWVHERVHHLLSGIYFGGGGAGMKVHADCNTKFPAHFLEVGSKINAGIVSLGAAISYLSQVGLQKIMQHVHSLTRLLVAELRKIDWVQFSPGIASSGCNGGYGIVSFSVYGLSSQEVGFILSEFGICIRAGTHCAALGNKRDDWVRVSLHGYNTKEEIYRLVEVLSQIK